MTPRTRWISAIAALAVLVGGFVVLLRARHASPRELWMHHSSRVFARDLDCEWDRRLWGWDSATGEWDGWMVGESSSGPLQSFKVSLGIADDGDGRVLGTYRTTGERREVHGETWVRVELTLGAEECWALLDARDD